MLPATKPQQCDSAASLTSNVDAEAVNATRFVARNRDVGRNPPFTISDMESIGRAQYQLQSTSGLKYYEVNNFTLHIQRESDITSDCDATDVELPNKNYESNGTEVYEPTENINIVDVTTEHTFVNIYEEKFTIKEELLDVTEQEEAVQSIKEKENVAHPPIKKKRILEEKNNVAAQTSITDTNNMNITDCLDTVKVEKLINPGFENIQTNDAENESKTVSVRTDTVNSNINLPHYDAKSSKNNFICDVCQKSFQKRTVLYEHIQGHFNLFNCTYCEYKTSRKKYLTNHVKTIHTKNVFFNCSYCSYKVNKKSDLIRHVNVKHTKSTVYNCSYCSYEAYDKSNFSRHINIKHTKITGYNCSYCDYNTNVKHNLHRHVNTVHVKSSVFICAYCGYETYRKFSLIMHIKTKHTNNDVFSCSICEYIASDNHSLIKHVKAKHTTKTVCSCPHCGYETHVKWNLSVHMNAKHTKNTVFNCSYCDYKSYDKSSLNRHANTKHTKDTLFKCSYCDYKTYHRSSLNRHANTRHTKNIVFNCSYCDYKAYDKNTLNRHENNKHTKNTVFNCSYCDYKVYDKRALYRHTNSKHNYFSI